MSQAERDAAYNNSLAVPGSDLFQQALAAASAAFRAGRAPATLAYGPHERQAVDLFDGGARVLVFIHGGYWQRGTRQAVSVLAEGPLAHGWSVAFPGYRLTPEVTLDDIVADLHAALDRLGERFGRLLVAGHSAGGQLAALALEHAAVDTAIAISGVFELGPVRETFLDEKLRLTPAQVDTLSPLRRTLVHKPLTLAYGAAELPALIANSRDFHAARLAATLPGELLPIAGADHFTVLEALRHPAGALCQVLPT